VVANNPELSNIVGILWTFGIGSALTAVAGFLSSVASLREVFYGKNHPAFGTPPQRRIYSLFIGKTGSPWGLVGGALLLATAQHLAAYYIGSQWMDAVAYIILILFLIARPLGFSGKRLKKVEI